MSTNKEELQDTFEDVEVGDDPKKSSFGYDAGYVDGYQSRKERPTGSTHIGDVDFFDEDAEDIADATWNEVFRTCCCHTPVEWAWIFLGICILVFFLYFFLLGLELLGTGAKVIGGCTAGSILGDAVNPIASLMIGILATVLLQSSSTTTSIMVSLVGAGSIGVNQAIYMVMGANIGTSVTNTIVAMGQMGNGDQLERAFAGATVHDMFNFLSVAVLLPVEAATGYLYYLTGAMVRNIDVSDGEKWEGPIKRMVAPLGNKIIIANKNIITDVAKGGSCADYYPTSCEDPSNPTQSTCEVGLIACDKTTNECPAFFQPGASQHDDVVSGGVCFFIALVILVACLIGLVTILQKLLLGMSTRILYKATNINGYLAILIGCGITILVQSSSITTSTLTPLVGMGVLQLEQMFPLTLGANIGTTVTALMASLVSDNVDSLQVALAHLFFNISGIVIWYPVPFMRRVPLAAARKLGKATRIWRGFPIVYIIVMFLLMPLALWGLSALFVDGTKGFVALGSILCVMLGLGIAWFVYWWRCKGGQQQCVVCMGNRQARNAAVRSLPKDMEYLQKKVAALADHTGLPEEEEESDEEEGEAELTPLVAEEKKAADVAPSSEATSEEVEEEEELEDNEVAA
jgi:sodium-dependent phosphate cotransporter